MGDLSKVGIVGAGYMGRRIAYSCIVSGKETRLYDISPDASRKAIDVVRSLVIERDGSRLRATGVASAMSRLSVKSSLAACVSGVDLVVEAVPEVLETKRQVFAEIDRHADPDTLIATNTSALLGSPLAAATRRPEKVVNFNFGHPEHRKVEVMAHSGTAPSTVEATLEFLRSLDLVPILVRREIMGYATNRIWRAVKKEVLFLLDRGYTSPDDIDRGWILDWGSPIGPCAMLDRIGLDVIRDVEMVYYQSTGDPSDRPPKILNDMVEQGKLGVKSGEGFYTYPNPRFEEPGWLEGRAEETPVGTRAARRDGS
jgi:3-hydroxybutyryl-CoA dehydrogenase